MKNVGFMIFLSVGCECARARFVGMCVCVFSEKAVRLYEHLSILSVINTARLKCV